MSRVLFRKPSQQNINYIDIWSKKIKLLIQTFTLYEPECANFLNCKEKIIGIYRPIFEYINNPELTYVKGNHLDVFILPELPTDKPYNEIFNKILDDYNTPNFKDFYNPIFASLVMEYGKLLKQTTLFKIDNCRDKYAKNENLKSISVFPELDVIHINKKPQLKGQTIITDYISVSVPKLKSQSKPQSKPQHQSKSKQTQITEYYNSVLKAKTLSDKNKSKITSYFTSK